MDLTDDKPQPEHYNYYEELNVSSDHHYYISTEISQPAHYAAMIHQIQTATAADTIVMHINSSGGDLATGIQIISAMNNTAAHVITSLEGDAYSLASMIFLSGAEMRVHNYSRIMIHHYSGLMVGKGSEQVSQLKSDIEWFAELTRDIYVPFISERELKTVLNGEDLWINTTDIRKRLKRLAKTVKD